MIRHFSLVLPAVLLVTRILSGQDISNAFWDPITDADRQMRAPIVDKEAGVEAIFWKVHVEDQILGDDPRRLLKHYVRLKVFDEKGKESTATIDIEYPTNTAIVNVVARTVKADGAIVDMKRDAVYERDLVRASGRKIKVLSFAVPAVEPGAIVEFRYTESHDKPDLLYQRLQFQREYPVQKVIYYLRPLPGGYTSYHMAIWPFHCHPSPAKVERDGSESITLENVDAFHDEPKMSSDANVRPWALLMYRQDSNRDPDKYWSEVGKRRYNELKDALKVDNQLKQTVSQVTQGTRDEATVTALLQYLWAHTRAFNDPGVTDADRAKVKMPKGRWRTAGEVLTSGLGTADELNLVFAAMAASAGLEARPALMPSRQDILFEPKMTDEYFLDSVDMAVKIGDAWKLYDVSARNLPPGMLSWPEEGLKVLLTDPKKPAFIDSPIAPPEASLTQRTATLALSEDGALEGDMEETYTGHSAADRRREFQGESEARQQDRVKHKIVAVYAQAEVTGITVKNVGDPTKPLEVRYHLKLARYASRTPKRILLQPLYFQQGKPPVFTAATRRHAIVFPYAWKEVDKVSIELPPGFTLEQPETPAPISFGSGSYTFAVSQTGNGELSVRREFVFGKDGAIFLAKDSYAPLKRLFDEIYGHDTQAVSLTATASAQ